MLFSPLKKQREQHLFEALEAQAVLLEWGCKHGLAQVDQTSNENRKA